MSAPFIVAVSGGRDYTDEDHIFEVLDGIHGSRDITLLIEGGCPVGDGGADARARLWAAAREVNCLTIPPKALKHRWPSAGPYRNREMAEHKPHLWVLFPGGRGTRSAKEIAAAHGIDIYVAERPTRVILKDNGGSL